MILTDNRATGLDLNDTAIRVIAALNMAAWYGGTHPGSIQLDTDVARARSYQFTLRMSSSNDRGACWPRGVRRSHHACWHTHRDVMLGIFAIRPYARLTTGVAKYNDDFNFRARFPETYYDNVGSLADPCNRGDACRCDMGARVYHPSVRTVLESLGAML